MRSAHRQAADQLDAITEGEDAKAVKGNKTGGKKDVLKILAAQKGRSIGFENDKDLNTERADALDYYKGKPEGAIARDLPTLENRSAIVSTDVANGVETALPDIIGIFTEGEDGLTFKPHGLEDVEAARQETDYVRHIIFQQNDGWQLLYEGIKDALISKTGIFHFYWDDDVEYEDFTTEASEPQIEELEEQGIEIVDVQPTNVTSINGFPVFQVTMRKPCSEGHVGICTVPPEDFTVSPDTVKLKDTEYCAMRTKVSRQSLIEQGHDKEDVLKLDASEFDDSEKQARDTANENSDSDDEGSRMLEMVDIVTHYLRVDLEGTGRRQIWRIVTGNEESIELSREKRSMIEFAAITPFPMPHRFYGQSLADKLMQTQKWKTTVTRQVNDHLYFSNNQRQEVKKAGIVAGITIEQLVDNAPGKPVVTEDGNSLKPIQNGSLGIDALGLLEYISVDSENRTGIVRNAQGIAPDTMHETAEGSRNLINAAQKRHRMMARLFAEGGIRDLYLGVHDIARQNATMQDTVQLRGTWVEVSPSSWRRRKDMTVEIGIGSGGTDDDLVRMNQWRGALTQLVDAQGGMEAKDPLVTKQNLYNAAMSLADKLRIKDAATQVTDPKKAEEIKQLAGEQEEPQVPPEVMQAQMELKIEQETQAARIQLETEKAKTQAAIDMAKARESAALEREKAQLAMDLEREKAAAKLQLEREAAQFKMQLERERAQFEADLANENAEREYALAEKAAKREAMIEGYRAKRDADNDADEIKNNRPGGSLAE